VLGDCLLAWAPPRGDDEIAARAAAYRVAEVINLIAQALTKK
jgi:hypothetical protein